MVRSAAGGCTNPVNLQTLTTWLVFASVPPRIDGQHLKDQTNDEPYTRDIIIRILILQLHALYTLYTIINEIQLNNSPLKGLNDESVETG